MIRQETLQDYADMICEDRNVSRVSVRIAPTRTRHREFLASAGNYCAAEIKLYLADEHNIQLDDVRQTLLHEISHHVVEQTSEYRQPAHGKYFYQVLNELMQEYGVTEKALKFEKSAYRSFAWRLTSLPKTPIISPPLLSEYNDPVEFGAAYAKFAKRDFFSKYFTGEIYE